VIDDDFKAAASIRDAVARDVPYYFSMKDANEYWAAFKQAMIEWESRKLPPPCSAEGVPIQRAYDNCLCNK
jgi:hypothetical protein